MSMKNTNACFSPRRRHTGIFLTIVFVLSALGLHAQSNSQKEHWVASWSAPVWVAQLPQPNFAPRPGQPGAPQAGAPGQPPANSNAAPSSPNSAAAPSSAEAAAPRPPALPAAMLRYRPVGPILNSVSNQTIRMIGRLSMGGSTFRIRLTNSFGAQPVTITAVHAALRTKDAAIDPATDKTLTFSGKSSVTLGPGVELFSDPFNLNAPNLSHFAVTIYVQGDSGPTSHTALASHNITYVAPTPGDFTAAKDIEGATLSAGYYWLSGIDVVAPKKTTTIVALGDSITDATGSPFEDKDWPSLLAERLLQNKKTSNFSVANVGISGNRVLRDGAGTSALSRFEKNVLAQPNVRWVVLLEGINDIGGGNTDADQLIQAYQQIIEKAHAHQIGIIGCTVLPFKGAFYYSDEKDKVRQAVNNWIRTSGVFDAVVDFEGAVKDPADPQKMREDLQRGDYLHPNAAGYAAMSQAVDLSVFLKPPKM
jgi:lysophospholipase L1-like esterase